MMEDREQMTEDGRQRSDDRNWNSEVGMRPPAHRSLRPTPRREGG